MRKDPVSFSKSLIRKYWISNVITKWTILQYQIDGISELIFTELSHIEINFPLGFTLMKMNKLFIEFLAINLSRQINQFRVYRDQFIGNK